MSDSPNPGLWIDQDNAAAWSEALKTELKVWLAALAGDGAQELNSLSVKIEPPTQEAARKAYEGNWTLRGMVSLTWNAETIRLRMPMSYHGVFLSSRPRLKRGLASAWGSWLGEAPGLRLVRPADEVEAGRKTIRWRLGLPGGGYIGARLSDRETLAGNMGARYFGDPAPYPEAVRKHLALFGLRSSGNLNDALLQLSSKIEPTAEDELDHRILLTFPVWLKHKVPRELLKALLRHRKEDAISLLQAKVDNILRGRDTGNLDTVKGAWAAMKEHQQRVANRLEWAINGHKSDERTDYIDPVNPLDLASRITRVNRISDSRANLALVNAARRQNLPSFRGKLCPLESPESELVGLSLQLASGASVDLDGKIHPASDPAGELGFGARLVPFLAHNDGARNMMGAKNLRQAVPLRQPQAPAVRTGGEEILEAFTRPLVEIGLCPEAKGAGAPPSVGQTGSEFALGRDLLVAYLPWQGMNFEDALVVGKQVVDKGLLDLSFTKTFRKKITRGWVPADPLEQTILPWSREGLAKPGDELFAGSPVAHFVWEGKGDAQPRVIRHGLRTPAVLKSIRFTRKSEWTGGVLEYELEMPMPLKPGDKLMGRHGNKGVVGAIIPEVGMPHLPDDKSLPEQLRGRPIDILLNPHGVISRMNLGQLIETHLGWLLHGGFPEADFRKAKNSEAIGAPFGSAVDHDKVPSLLEKSGLDRYGRIPLILPVGGTTATPVVVGFQHIVRLRHMPEMKSQARRGNSDALYSARTGQAVRGRKQGGGQRVGEMEMWALAAHQSHALMAEIQGIKSSAELVAMAANESLGMDGYTGYRRVLQDWLFAMLFALDIGEEVVGFGFVPEKDIRDRAGRRGQVFSPAGLTAVPTASFCCREGGKRKPCGHSLLGKTKVAFPSTASTAAGKAPTLCLADLLARFGLRVDGPIVPSGEGQGSYAIPLMDLQTGKPTKKPLLVELGPAGMKSEASSVVGKISGASGQRVPRWPGSLEEVSLYGQFPKSAGDNWTADALIEEFCKDPEVKRQERANGARGVRMSDRTIAEMRIACPSHPTKPLSGSKPFGQYLWGEAGGLFDPAIFGQGMPNSTDSSAGRWGFIELPFALCYPVPLIFSETSNSDDPETKMCPLVKLLPVLPTRYRVPGERQGELVADELDRLGYAPLVELIRRCRKEMAEQNAQLRKLEEESEHSRAYAEALRNLRLPAEEASEAVKKYIEAEAELHDLVVSVPSCALYRKKAGELRELEDLKSPDPESKRMISDLRSNLKTMLISSGSCRNLVRGCGPWVVPVLLPLYEGGSAECRRYVELEQALAKWMRQGDCKAYAESVAAREAELRQMEKTHSECARYAQAHAKAEVEIRTKYTGQLQKRLGELFHLLIGALNKKSGLVRRDGLGRRVDRSARMVVIPNPELAWDSVGIPVVALLELMGDRLDKWLAGLTPEKREHLPKLEPVSWLRPRENPNAVKNGLKIVEAYLDANPDFVVLLNRQPSLHRDSVQAFHPLPLPPEAGEVIQLCPLACKGFGADFDGDEMAAHLPLSLFAQMEAKELLPSANLFSLAAKAPGNVLAHFDQDFVLGTWWLCRDQPAGSRDAFKESLPESPREQVPEAGSSGFKGAASALLHAVAEESSGAQVSMGPATPNPAAIIHGWMRQAFAACTTNGVSFGYYELREIAAQIAAEVAKKCKLPPGEVNQALDRVVNDALAKILKEGDPTAPGFHFAAMALSGARGGKQVRQVLAARGLLDPGATAWACEINDFVFRPSLVEGLAPEEAFLAAMNARSSMCDKKIGTAYAGGLTRSLVFAMWDRFITSEDCGNDATDRNPATCKEVNGFCAKCYGSLPDGTESFVGFPAGLIAAQSIGERGTQLSMQSFHGGERALNIQWVRFVLGLGAAPPGTGRMPFAFAEPGQVAEFIAEMKKVDAYTDLHDRHFQILWRVLNDLKGRRKIATAINKKDPITLLSHRKPAEEVLIAAMRGEKHSRKNPFAELLFGAASTTES